ncbi:MAG: PadR family transcriptional regulator [Chloroflexi bacterium]|nr:PadR family transcriptional regulator [Chloroflexota bacterium]
MSLKYAMLGTLSIKPMSGYDVKKSFERSVGLIWNANYSQIYAQLHRLDEEGLVQKQEVIQNGKPNKKLYSLTDDGLRELKAWLAEPIAVADLKDEFMLKFFFSDHLDREALRSHLVEGRRLMKEREQAIELVTTGRAPTISNIGSHAAQMGVRYYRLYVQWIEEALELLDEGRLCKEDAGKPMASPAAGS